jgi:hypothetical protein
MEVGSEAYVAALFVYQYVRAAGKGAAGWKDSAFRPYYGVMPNHLA